MSKLQITEQAGKTTLENFTLVGVVGQPPDAYFAFRQDAALYVDLLEARGNIPNMAAFIRAARELAEAAAQYEQASFGTVAIDTDRLMAAAEAMYKADARPGVTRKD